MQRAGRAGRRRETRSTALTLCKANPHDQNVFLNTRWAFDTVLAAPVVSLNSATIVQRHVNAMVLAQFLRELLVQEPKDLHKLACGWFFIASAKNSHAVGFAAWCQVYFDGLNSQFEQGLQQVVRRTALEGLSASQLVGRCGGHIQNVTERWLGEWNALLQQEGSVGGDAGDPALKAIAFQKNRLSNEYLLRELATDGFLPAYGFPAFVASFDNLTISGIRNLSETKSSGRDDNRYLRRELASRDLVTALREYAPGAEIVLDGLVYRSSGITLNWHIPASESDARETQAIKFAWKCSKCGASGTSVVMTQSCDACGSEISGNIERFLEPAGFSVDFYEDPHNNVMKPTFVAVERPWVSARGEWSSLPNPNLGRYRQTTEGRVYHHSKGANGTGYAICLACGRAEPLTTLGELPSVFTAAQGHFKLRAKKGDRMCPGSSNRWAITKTVLGHELRTDMIELQLRFADAQPVTDHSSALTLAVALRGALAALIGVQSAELGCEARETRNAEGARSQSIFIFDKFAAGYASGAERLLPEMFSKAAQILKCPKNCESSCPNCVLDFDQRFEASVLDRKAALRLLTPGWLNLLTLPAELQYFGASSQVESSPLTIAIVRESGAADAKGTRLYGSGEAEKWDFAGSALRRTAYKLLSMSRPVEVVIPPDLVSKLSEGDRYSLAALSDHPNAIVRTIEKPQLSNGVAVLAEVERANGSIAWACTDVKALLGSEEWGQTSQPLICGHKQLTTLGKPLSSNLLRPVQVDNGDKEISIQRQLDGWTIKTFGDRLWKFIRQNHPATNKLLGSVAVKSSQLPTLIGTCSRLFPGSSGQVFGALRSALGSDRFGKPEVRLTTTSVRYMAKKRWEARCMPTGPLHRCAMPSPHSSLRSLEKPKLTLPILGCSTREHLTYSSPRANYSLFDSIRASAIGAWLTCRKLLTSLRGSTYPTQML